MTSLAVSRRRFLGVAAGAAGATLWGWSPARGADAPKFGRFKVGLQTYTLRSYKVDEALKHARDFGCEHVELFNAHFALNSTDAQIDAMKEKTQQLGLRISAHGVNGFSKNHEANRKIFEFCKKAGIRNISADPSEDSFDSLEKLVAEFNIRIAIHNHGPGARYDKIASVLTAIKDRHPHIGACADLGHFIRSAEDPVRAITLLKGRLFGIHLKDFAEPKGNAKGTILGKGVMDVAAVFKALKQVDFPGDGALSLEYEENASNPLADVKECFAIAATAAAKVG